MLKQALCIAKGAALRTESRGGHTREDHTARDDGKWLNRSLARWPEGADEPEFTYEPVGILELPPGDRGYGGAEMLPMSQTVEEYNAGVKEAWIAEGWHETAEPLGSELVEMTDRYQKKGG